jgi:hypothetical protein
MSFLKSYLVPKKTQKKTDSKPAEINPTEKTPTTPTPFLDSNTPGHNTPWTSRPASLAPGEEMSDTRCEILVSWLHQQQIEKTWFDVRADDEGVVLKKSKGEYVCCPEHVGEAQHGFCRAIEALNVRVSPDNAPPCSILTTYTDHR